VFKGGYAVQYCLGVVLGWTDDDMPMHRIDAQKQSAFDAGGVATPLGFLHDCFLEQPGWELLVIAAQALNLPHSHTS